MARATFEAVGAKKLQPARVVLSQRLPTDRCSAVYTKDAMCGDRAAAMLNGPRLFDVARRLYAMAPRPYELHTSRGG